MIKKYLKQEWFLTTEVLPSEIPTFFSNLPLKNELEELLEHILDKDKRSDFDKYNINYSIPLKYEIPKNNSGYRIISLMHPTSQLKFLLYIMKYEYLLINFLQKSKFNIRKVQKANKITFTESKAIDKERLKIEQDFGITGNTTITNEELDRFFKKYFTYNRHHNLSCILKSPSFIRDSLKYRFFSKLDIQNFFESIYTHSITWAIVGDKHLGKEYSKKELKNTFAAQSDIIQQKCNENETNGIIVGPEINRIIADIILTHCDYNIEKNLNQQNITFNKDYKIYRFIDDYYIFSSTHEILELLEQEISRELSIFHLKLNLDKHQIKEQPFSLDDTSIIQLKYYLNAFNNNRELKFLKLLNNPDTIEKYRILLTEDSDNYRISIAQILTKEAAWIELYSSIRNIISIAPSSKRRVVLYFLKTISLEIYEPIFINQETTNYNKIFFKYFSTINTALDQINNIYSIHPDYDTTKAYINTLITFMSSISKLELTINTNNNGKFIKNCKEYLLAIENRIFENIYQVLKNNSNRINNISDLIVYLKFFKKKLSSQFLCHMLDENSDDYFTICAISYYIIGDTLRYKVVLNYLFKLISNFINNYKTHTKNLLDDAKYFYILNDFLYYPEFQCLEIEGQLVIDILNSKKDEYLNNKKNFEKFIFEKFMKQSYYNWNLTHDDFKKIQIQKIITDKYNYFSDGY